MKGIGIKILLLVMLCCICCTAFAADDSYHVGKYGGVDYTWTLNALHEANRFILVMMQYMLGILYSIASLLSLYSALVIFMKVQAGEDGFLKATLTLVGSFLFLIGATMVMPAFFGIRYFSGDFNLW